MPGDLVEVRSAGEILSTLDEQGTVRRAFKTCVDDGYMRQLDDTVFLEEVRCDGAAHGGCDRGCPMFWKTAWLKPAGSPPANGHAPKAKVGFAGSASGQFLSATASDGPKLHSTSRAWPKAKVNPPA